MFIFSSPICKRGKCHLDCIPVTSTWHTRAIRNCGPPQNRVPDSSTWKGTKPDPTQAEMQGEPPLLELQGDVVSTLTFSMEQNSISLHALELQRDHIFESAHQLLIEPIQKGASAIKVSNIWFWEQGEIEREREISAYPQNCSFCFSS